MPKRAISKLFQAHEGELFAFLTRKVRNRDTAAELTQETFARFMARGPDGAASIGNQRAYLFRMAFNLAIDHLRKNRDPARDMAGTALEDIADPAPTPEHVYSNKERLALVDEALAALPARTRTIFLLRRVDGLSYRDIADRMDLSESSIQKHLASALKSITQHLRSADGGPS